MDDREFSMVDRIIADGPYYAATTVPPWIMRPTAAVLNRLRDELIALRDETPPLKDT
jgi:hypothetical protein